MAGTSVKSNPAKARKRVEASQELANSSLVRAKNGSAFTRCEECKKDVPVALISFHSCSLDAKIKMNLEAQVVEKPAETKKPSETLNKKPFEKKKSTATEPKAKRAKVEKKGKKASDKNKPKRPATAFFIFMDDFRKEFKETHPDSKDVKTVAKEGGERWKSLTDEEKKPYQDKAAELKAAYQKALEADNAEDAEADDAGEVEEDEAVLEKDEKEEEALEKEEEVEKEESDDE